MAFMAGQQNERALLGHGLEAIQSILVHDKAIEHGLDDPGQQRFIDFNRPGAIVGRDFVKIIVRFFEKPGSWFVFGFGQIFYKFLERGAGEDIFLDFQAAF